MHATGFGRRVEGSGVTVWVCGYCRVLLLGVGVQGLEKKT